MNQIPREVHVKLPGKGNSNSRGARPVHLIITMEKWTLTSRLSINNSLSLYQIRSTADSGTGTRNRAKEREGAQSEDSAVIGAIGLALEPLVR